jgi:hypothetical protein
MDITRVLQDENGNEINSMGTSWTTRAYALGDNLHLCIHLFWTSITPQGVLTLEYSGDPVGDNSEFVQQWIAKDITHLDGSFQDQMYLDANLPVASFRLKYVRISGTAGLSGYIVKKRK